ncbi:LysR substrate-binding domain-containing protein [Actinomycetes bacterium KLBMP 9759]
MRTFLVVADLASFSQAARALSISQPALSKQIQVLESDVGAALFDRGRHGAFLTVVGQVLLPDAQRLVRDADALARRVRHAAGGGIGRLSVGFGLSSIELAPLVVARFRREHPECDVLLDDIPSLEQEARLRSGELSVGFTRRPSDPELSWTAMRDDRLALAHTGERPATLQGSDLIRLARVKGPGLAAQIDRYCAEAGLRLGTLQEAHDLQTVLALVTAGIGVALVPSSARRIAPEPVVLDPVEHEAAAWQSGVAWRPSQVTPLIANFLRIATEVSRSGQ